jgi:hypothetical protein
MFTAVSCSLGKIHLPGTIGSPQSPHYRASISFAPNIRARFGDKSLRTSGKPLAGGTTRMTSPAQTEANRANAQLSTGPATAPGKAAVRFNATRHGLTSQVACMPWEDRAAFDKFCAALVAEYKPDGVVETQLAQSIAEDNWRLNRARAIEHNIFALGFPTADPNAESDNPQIDVALAQAQTFVDQSKTFALITLYEQRINRALKTNLERLREAQTERRAARAHTMQDLLDHKEYEQLRPRIAARAAERGETPGPEEVPMNGFVFSSSEIDYAIFHRRRTSMLGAATELAGLHPKRGSRHAA